MLLTLISLMKISNLAINDSISIHVSQVYSSIKIHAAINRRILKYILIFGDLKIDLISRNAAHTSSIRTSTSRNVDEVINYVDLLSFYDKYPRHLSTKWTIVLASFALWTFITRPIFPARSSNAISCHCDWAINSPVSKLFSAFTSLSYPTKVKQYILRENWLRGSLYPLPSLIIKIKKSM